MSQGGDAGPAIAWLQIIIAAAVAGIGGFCTAVVMAFRSAWKLSEQLKEMEAKITKSVNDLRLHVDASDSKRFHDMINIVDAKIAKCDGADIELSRRIGATEQEIAVLKDFKDRSERHIATEPRKLHT